MNARVHPPVHSANHAPSYYAASANRQLARQGLAARFEIDRASKAAHVLGQRGVGVDHADQFG